MSLDDEKSIGADEKTAIAVDLGLQALLQGYVESPTNKEPVVKNDSVPAASATLVYLRALMEQRNWALIVTSVEPLLESPGDLGIASKLYWILAQARQKSLPKSFLLGPYDQVKLDAADGRSSEIDTLFQLVQDALGIERESNTGQSTVGALKPVVPIEPFPKQPASFAGFSTPVFSSPEAALTKSPTFQAVPLYKTTRSRTLDYALLLLIIATTVGAYWFIHSSGVMATVTAAPIMLEVGDSQAALLEPILSQKPSVSSLGALFYDVQKSWAPTIAIQPVSPTPAVSSVLNVTIPAVPAKENSKTTVNTSGPIEPRDIAQKVQGRESRDRNGTRGDGDRRDIDRMHDRRLPEIPIDRGWYRIINSSRILSEPGSQGRIIGKVNRGDEVLVEAQFGRWARLKSPKSGRSGFIDAEVLDSAPLKDP